MIVKLIEGSNMGVAKPVVLPSIRFEKQGDADAFFKAMLESYEDDEYLNSADEEVVYELLQRHPEAATKIGSGVVGIFRAPSLDHPSSCFHVHRVDGSKTDFSYKICVKAKSPSLKSRFYEACQRSITNTVIAQKLSLFNAAGGKIACYKTGVLTTFSSSDYRHTEPRFREIVENFIKINNILVSEDLLSNGADMQYSTVFIDHAMASAFVNYHEAVAELQVFKRFEIPVFS
ncbi:DCL family protein [Pseudomonas taetrolens]|uniref:DCL family protein n=1 Tax=Pseudomonas taetrolens TaxID=47884 RepID=UPI0037C61789